LIAAHGNTPLQSCSFELTSVTRTFGESHDAAAAGATA
jgi:hypothetical protein